MEQKKTGLFLKELRKEKGLTQEELAEKFFISSRSVSRWETGTNLPDLSILVELADFYNVDIREIIDGERRNENMNHETKETLNKVVEYSAEEKKQIKKRMAGNCVGAMLLLLFCTILSLTHGFNGLIAEGPYNNLLDFTMGLSMAILFLNALYLTGHLEKVNKIKAKLFQK